MTNKDAGNAGSSRWYIWQVSLPLITDHFWLGSGPNTFQEIFHPHDKDTKKYIGDGGVFDENNDYLQIALTMGVPALLLYILFISIAIVKGFIKGRKLESEGSHAVRQQILTYGILASIMGYLVQAFFNITVISVAPYFWILLGCVVSSSRVSVTKLNKKV